MNCENTIYKIPQNNKTGSIFLRWVTNPLLRFNNSTMAIVCCTQRKLVDCPHIELVDERTPSTPSLCQSKAQNSSISPWWFWWSNDTLQDKTVTLISIVCPLQVRYCPGNSYKAVSFHLTRPDRCRGILFQFCQNWFFSVTPQPRSIHLSEGREDLIYWRKIGVRITKIYFFAGRRESVTHNKDGCPTAGKALAYGCSITTRWSGGAEGWAA